MEAKQDRAFRIVEDKMRDLILALDAFELISWFNNKDFAFYCETLHYLAYLDRLESAPSDES